MAYQSNWEWVQWLIGSIGSGSSGLSVQLGVGPVANWFNWEWVQWQLVQLGVGPVAYQSNWEWVQWLITSIGSGSSG